MHFFRRLPHPLPALLAVLITAVVFITTVPTPPAKAQIADGTLVSRTAAGTVGGVAVSKLTYMSDGLKVNGFLFTPKASGKLPCVIFNHDGISGVSKEHKLSSARLAKAGYVVFSPSYRGEDGSQGNIEIAKGEVKDVLNAVTLVSSLPEVNKDRIALAGASHGALISILAAAKTTRIKAVVTAYGVADIYKWWDYLKAHNKIGKDKITKQTYGNGPKDRPDSFAIRNAVSYVKNISCPVLILQGEKDDIVPPEQARFLKDALDKHKIRNTMVIYPDCLHGFLVYVPFIKNVEKAERQQTEQAWSVMLSFLNQHMK